MLLALVLGQPASDAYAGTWIAELAGSNYVRLELTVTAGTLGGRISLGDIHVDAAGVVDTVLAPPHSVTPVFDVERREGGLLFARKNDDDIEHFEIRLLGRGDAELVFRPTDAERQQLADNGIPMPKPIRLKRVVP